MSSIPDAAGIFGRSIQEHLEVVGQMMTQLPVLEGIPEFLGASVFGSKDSSSSSSRRGIKPGVVSGRSMYSKWKRATLFPSLRKACLFSNPEISESMTSGSTWRSTLKFLPDREPSKCVFFMRSISTFPIALLTRSAAFGSVVLRKIFVAG